jgi:hypothetical protein
MVDFFKNLPNVLIGLTPRNFDLHKFLTSLTYKTVKSKVAFVAGQCVRCAAQQRHVALVPSSRSGPVIARNEAIHHSRRTKAWIATLRSQ